MRIISTTKLSSKLINIVKLRTILLQNKICYFLNWIGVKYKIVIDYNFDDSYWNTILDACKSYEKYKYNHVSVQKINKWKPILIFPETAIFITRAI